MTTDTDSSQERKRKEEERKKKRKEKKKKKEKAAHRSSWFIEKDESGADKNRTTKTDGRAGSPQVDLSKANGGKGSVWYTT